MINTHNLVCDFGTHIGKLYTRMPIGYLKWMVNVTHSRAEIAQAELARRGTVTPTLEITGHAIDRASLRYLKVWQETHHNNEGLNAWLVRISEEALKKYPDTEKIEYMGLTFIFENDGIWPVLKTIM